VRPLTAAEAVELALEHGSLYGAGCGRTVAVDGRRYPTVRVQSAIFGRLYGTEAVYCAELWSAIDAALNEHRRAKTARYLR
jgi:hypothetical protein